MWMFVIVHSEMLMKAWPDDLLDVSHINIYNYMLLYSYTKQNNYNLTMGYVI